MEAKTVKLKLDLDATGRGSLFLDEKDIGHCVTAIEFKAGTSDLTEIKITIHAELDASIEAYLDQIALRKDEPKKPEGIIRSADGRELKIRNRAN